MNPIHNNSWHRVPLSLYELVLFGCMVLPAHAYTEAQNSEILVTGSSTVEELLRLDSRAALELARRQVFGGSPGTTATAVLNDAPALIAIYGTGRNLSAELLISGRTVIFHGTGKQSVSGIAHGYSLERIAPPCVYLSKDEVREIACLELHTP